MKIIIISLLLAISFNSLGQEKSTDAAFLYVVKDDLEGTQFFTPSYDMIVSNKEKTEGAKLSMHLKKSGSFSFITAKLIGLGNCVDDNELIILFENGEKLQSTSWNDFNCKGDAYFNITKEGQLLLSSEPMKTIRVRNGESFKTVTSSDFSNPLYFVQLFDSINTESYTLLED